MVSLVFDFPTTMAFVADKIMKKSASPPQEWIRVAIRNLKVRTPQDWLRVMDEEKGVRCSHLNDSV